MKQLYSLGQIFLKDKNYIKKILKLMHIDNEVVLEIGSGDGRITEMLLEKVKFLYAIEFDYRFIDILKNRFQNISNIEIIQADILKFSFGELNKKLIIFGNIPYQISSPLINCLITNRKYIKKVYLTLQKEFADRLTADISTKQYGFLTCYLRYYGFAEKLLHIPARAFSPRPEVDSNFISIEFYEKLPYKVRDEKLLFKIIRIAFSQRRKKIINSLPILKEKKDLLLKLKLNEFARAENLSIKDYVFLTNKISFIKNFNLS